MLTSCIDPRNARRSGRAWRVRELRREACAVSGRARLARHGLLPAGRRGGDAAIRHRYVARRRARHRAGRRAGARGTDRVRLAFDPQHASREDGVCLVLGYNTAVFMALLRWRGKKILINMDGIEWRRPKWSLPVRAWFYLNEWLGAWLGHRLVADHPAIEDHLATRRPRGAIAMIPYGGDEVTAASAAPVAALGLTPQKYLHLDRAHRAGQQHPADGAGVLAQAARREAGRARQARSEQRLSRGGQGGGERRGDLSRRDLRQGSRAGAALPCARLLPRPHGRRHQSVAGRGAVVRQCRAGAPQPLQSSGPRAPSSSSSPMRTNASA